MHLCHIQLVTFILAQDKKAKKDGKGKGKIVFQYFFSRFCYKII